MPKHTKRHTFNDTVNPLMMLSCGCVKKYNEAPPSTGDLVTCWSHGPAKVLKPKVEQWFADCLDCSWSVSYGMAQLNAEVGACNHRKRKPSHTVKILTPDGSLHRTLKPQQTLGDF